MCLFTRAQEEAGFPKGEAVRTIVGDELAVIIVVTQLSTLLDVGHSSDTVQSIVIASNVVRGTGHRRLSRYANNEERERKEKNG